MGKEISKDFKVNTMSNKDRDHTKCRKLGTSDLCVCCPCGCDTPMDAPNYAELHGAPTEQKEEWEEELKALRLRTEKSYGVTNEWSDSFSEVFFDDLANVFRTQLALAEERGRDAQQKEDYEIAKAHQEKAFKSGTEMGENRGRREVITENTSDGYHTFKELYEFRKMFNAALFNEWAKQGKYSVHKSMRHGDGELAFGGGWFIVMATLPTGQISNHYEMKDYDLFECEEREKADAWDGHTAYDVLQRLSTITQKS